MGLMDMLGALVRVVLARKVRAEEDLDTGERDKGRMGKLLVG